MSVDPLRVGLIGVGTGAKQLIPALTRTPSVRFVAAADVRPAALERLAAETGVSTYTSAEALCDSPDVEAVWIATPNRLHARQAIAAAERGKHVIVSKPLAVTLDEAAAMNAAAERNGVYLLAGHTQSTAPTIRRMAALARGGELGRLGMVHTWHFTDWLYRPRLPDELDVTLGGGPVYRQASHQVDIIRLIGGGLLRRVRAATVDLDPARGAPGAYTAYLEFANGMPATIVYSGYGHLDMAALLRGSEQHGAAAVEPPAATPASTTVGQDEAARKEALRYGGSGADVERAANTLGLFGFTLATCERGDIREAPDGLYVYAEGVRRLVPVPNELRGAAELDELYRAVRLGEPLTHSGRWGEATLEVCVAIHTAARTGQDVELTRQTAVPATADLPR